MKVFLISILYLCTVIAFPTEDRQLINGCVAPWWKGDGYCDDFNNFASCGFDGGDCCGSNVNKQYCSICACKQASTTAAPTTAAPTTAAPTTASPTTATPTATGCATIPSWMKTAMSNVTVSGLDRIINGKKAPSPIPWQAHLREGSPTGGFQFFCGGTIIDSTTILTAAHCYYSQNITNVSKYFIAAGATHVTDSSAQTAYIKSITLHENYNNNNVNNDVAILKLKTALTLNDKVKPACLPAATLNPSGKVAVASGWGLTGQSPDQQTHNLMYVAKPLIPAAQCRTNTQWTASDIKDTMICAGDQDGGESTCNGDSGGPLVIAGANDVATIVGTTSFGPKGCGTKGYPAVYAYTVKFINWIKAKMG